MKRSALILLSTLLLASFFEGEALSKTLTLTSQNGIEFIAYFYEAKKPHSPAVLILPGRMGRGEPYKRFARKLKKANINAMVINYYYLENLSTGRMSRKEWTSRFEKKRGGANGLVENEVTAALRFLRSHEKVDPVRIGIVGGRMGTWVGLLAMARFPDSRCLIMLSPMCGVPGKSFRTDGGTVDLANAFGKRHLFLVGSEKDRSAPEFPTAVEESEYLISILPKARIEKRYYPGTSHSHFLLKDYPELPSLIIQWLEKVL